VPVFIFYPTDVPVQDYVTNYRRTLACLIFQELMNFAHMKNSKTIHYNVQSNSYNVLTVAHFIY